LNGSAINSGLEQMPLEPAADRIGAPVPPAACFVPNRMPSFPRFMGFRDRLCRLRSRGLILSEWIQGCGLLILCYRLTLRDRIGFDSKRNSLCAGADRFVLLLLSLCSGS